jgi:hypothetical protein
MSSVAQQEKIEDEVRAQVVAYIAALPMAATLIYNKLLGRIMQLEEVQDATLEIGVDPKGVSAASALYQTNLATDGRKATVTPYSVFVELMEETVWLDIRVKLEPQPSARGGAEITPAHRSAIEAAITRTVADARGTLQKTQVSQAIREAIQSLEPALQLIAGTNAVVLNAEYVDTGRVLINPDAIVLEDHHMPAIRPPVTIELPGVLDV